jgi:hypothetical protein
MSKYKKHWKQHTKVLNTWLYLNRCFDPMVHKHWKAISFGATKLYNPNPYVKGFQYIFRSPTPVIVNIKTRVIILKALAHSLTHSLTSEKEKNGLQTVMGFKSRIVPEDLCISQNLFQRYVSLSSLFTFLLFFHHLSHLLF